MFDLMMCYHFSCSPANLGLDGECLFGSVNVQRCLSQLQTSTSCFPLYNHPMPIQPFDGGWFQWGDILSVVVVAFSNLASWQ